MTRPVDWFRVIVHLRQHGQSMAQVAREIGVPRQTIHGWAVYEATPLHDNGEALIDHWARVTGNSRSDVPRRR